MEKNIKIGIHEALGSFSNRWIEYCKEKNIPYKTVNAYKSDIIQEVSDCNIFIWHHHHTNYKDALFAKQLLFSLEISGKKVFPNFNTNWHFDDKVGQKYLLESINAPLVPSYVFYTQKDALEWIKNADFPKVFKLRGGAGSYNVKLVRSERAAIKLTNQAFSIGFSQFNRMQNLNERIRKFKEGKDNLLGVIKGIARLVLPTEYSKMYHREKGYIYFQDFIPNNKFDTRVVVIGGNKAFAEKRYVRVNDFRASGSGFFSYDNINIESIRIAFSISKKLKLQSAAFDFVLDQNDNPLILEISYGFGYDGIIRSKGFWTDDLEWHEEKVDPIGNILEEVLKASI